MLLTFVKKYNPHQQGVCHGFTTRWIEARLLQEDEILSKRVDYLHNHLKSILQLKKYPTDPVQRDALAFLESMIIFHNIKEYSYFPKNINQRDVESASIVASSDAIKKRGGLTLVNNLRIFSKDEFSAYLKEISKIIEALDPKTTEPIAFSLGTENHALGLTYELGIGWQYMDINNYPPKKIDNNQEQLITELIFDTYAQGFDYIPLNIDWITTQANPANQKLKEKCKTLQEQYEITTEIATRTGVVNLLWQACAIGNLDLVKELVLKGAQLDKTDKAETSSLSIACQNGYLEIARFLLAQGANINEKDESGSNPLERAAQNGHLEIVQLLLEKGAKINEVDEDGNNPFWRACENGHLEVATLLASQGADPLKTGIIGVSPLGIACQNGHLNLVRFLLEKGAKINEKDEEGWTPLARAADSGHLKIVQLLLEMGAKINEVDKYENNSFWRACENGHLEVATLLASQGADPLKTGMIGVSPLGIACQNGHLDLVRFLLEKGAKINEKDEEGRTPLERAAGSGHLTVVQLLLELDAKIDEVNKYGNNPFWRACENGHLEVATLLASQGADPMKAGMVGISPLGIACQNGHLDLVRFLLEKGAKINEKDETGSTALARAAQNGHIEIVQLLLEKGAEIAEVDEDGNTPFGKACKNGHLEMAKFLRDRGAEIDDSNKKGMRPLWMACFNGHFLTVQFLIKQRANINARDQEGFTPFFVAAQEGHLSILQLLYSEGENPQESVTRTVKELQDFAKTRSVEEKMQAYIDDYFLKHGHTKDIQIKPLDIAEIMGNKKEADWLRSFERLDDLRIAGEDQDEARASSYSPEQKQSCDLIAKKLLLLTRNYQNSLDEDSPEGEEIHQILLKLVAALDKGQDSWFQIQNFYSILDTVDSRSAQGLTHMEVIKKDKSRSTLTFLAGIAALIISLITLPISVPIIVGIYLKTGRHPLDCFKTNSERFEKETKLIKEKSLIGPFFQPKEEREEPVLMPAPQQFKSN